MNILVSIISEQLVPNYLFIKEMGDGVDEHILISTTAMEMKGLSDRLIKIANLVKFQKVIVIEDSLENIKDQLNSLKLPSDNRYILNLTGGTKIMSIGVYRFFEDFNHESYYLTLGRNTYKRIFPKNQDRETKIKYKMSVIEYFGAYGFDVKNSGLPFNTTESVANAFYQNNEELLSLRDERIRLNTAFNENKSKGATFDLTNENNLKDFLNNLPWKIKNPERLNYEEAQLIRGGWWEAYTYFWLKRKLSLPDENIIANLQLHRENVPNEIDVAFIIENTLYLVECKQGFDNKSAQKLFNDSIYKLAAIRKELGLGIKGFLFLAGAQLRDGKYGQIKKHFNERAKLMNTIIVDRPILENSEEVDAIFDPLHPKP